MVLCFVLRVLLTCMFAEKVKNWKFNWCICMLVISIFHHKGMWCCKFHKVSLFCFKLGKNL